MAAEETGRDATGDSPLSRVRWSRGCSRSLRKLYDTYMHLVAESSELRLLFFPLAFTNNDECAGETVRLIPADVKFGDDSCMKL
jgi:hypothetical protein